MSQTEEYVRDAIKCMYAKLREGKHKKYQEVIGLFVNYYYRLSGVHAGLVTEYMCLKSFGDIVYLAPKNERTSDYYAFQQEVNGILSSIPVHEMYALYLISSFENPLD